MDAIRAPSRCQAVFKGPSGTCQLSGTYVASAVGRTAPKAATAATERLQELLVATMAERLAHSEGLFDLDGARAHAASCLLVSEEAAHISCAAEEGLTELKTCYAAFPDRSCWAGGALTLEGPAWRMQEKGKQAICAEMEAQQLLAGASDQDRARCHRACIEQATATCP